MGRPVYLFIAGLLVSLSACKEAALPPAPDRPVRTTTVKSRVSSEPIVLTGHIRAREELKQSFRIDGKLTERLVSLGQEVKRNQLLARLDAQNELNALRANEAEVASAQASLTQARNNESRLRRNSAPTEQLDQAVQQVKTAEAQFDGAQAKLRIGQDRVSYAELPADATGVVIAKGAEPGEIVRAGQPIITIARNNAKDAVFNVPPQLLYVAGVTLDSPVEVALSENQNIVARGRISEISPLADPTTRTIAVRIALTDPHQDMRFGAVVTGRVVAASASIIEVPGAALTESDGLPAVWIVDPRERTVTLRTVRVARYEPTTVIIAQGLGEGEIVVTAGVQALRPGQKIRLLNDPT
jgi:membrane fusion protein, multidrug efflux system